MAHLDEAMLFAVEGRLGPYSTGKVYCSLISACEELGDLDRAVRVDRGDVAVGARTIPSRSSPGSVESIVRWCSSGAAISPRPNARRCKRATSSSAATSATARSRTPRSVTSGAASASSTGPRRRSSAAQALCGRPCAELALLRLAQGRTGAAMAIVSACLRDHDEPSRSFGAVAGIYVHVAIAADDLDAAHDALPSSMRSPPTFGTPRARGDRVVDPRALRAGAGRRRAARSSLQQALAAGARSTFPTRSPPSARFSARPSASRRRAGAAESFAAAASLFDHIGASSRRSPAARRPGRRCPTGSPNERSRCCGSIAAGKSPTARSPVSSS